MVRKVVCVKQGGLRDERERCSGALRRRRAGCAEVRAPIVAMKRLITVERRERRKVDVRWPDNWR